MGYNLMMSQIRLMFLMKASVFQKQSISSILSNLDRPYQEPSSVSKIKKAEKLIRKLNHAQLRITKRLEEIEVSRKQTQFKFLIPFTSLLQHSQYPQNQYQHVKVTQINMLLNNVDSQMKHGNFIMVLHCYIMKIGDLNRICFGRDIS